MILPVAALVKATHLGAKGRMKIKAHIATTALRKRLRIRDQHWVHIPKLRELKELKRYKDDVSMTVQRNGARTLDDAAANSIQDDLKRASKVEEIYRP